MLHSWGWPVRGRRRKCSLPLAIAETGERTGLTTGAQLLVAVPRFFVSNASARVRYQSSSQGVCARLATPYASSFSFWRVQTVELRHEQQELAIQRVFGSGARLGGSIGSGRHPGVLTIAVDGKPWGSGRTLQEAIGQALGRAATLSLATVPPLASGAA